MKIKNIKKPLMLCAATIVAAAGASGYVWYTQNRPKVLEVYIFALKSSQAVFIRTPEDKRILIDGGPNSEIIRQITSILPFYSRRIDTIIVSHPEAKYVTGLVDVLERYDIGRVYVPSATSSDVTYKTFVEAAERRRIPVLEIGAGDNIAFDQHASVQVLLPLSVLRLEYSTTSMLLVGNVSTKIQKKLVSAGLEHSDVLVFSQNPISSNLNKDFIAKIDPRFFIFSKTISKKSEKPTANKSSIDMNVEKQFNLREKGVVKVISDGTSITIK